MRTREIPPAVGWVVVAVVAVVAAFFIYRAGAPSKATGGKPNDRDRQLLQQMGEARARSQAGRGAGTAGQPAPAQGAGAPR